MALKFNSSDITRIENRITDLVQDEIRRKDLIDTGLMLNSVETVISLENGELDMEVTSTDYFKYVDGDYDIVSDALETSTFKSILSDIEELIANAMEESFGF